MGLDRLPKFRPRKGAGTARAPSRYLIVLESGGVEHVDVVGAGSIAMVSGARPIT
ncbi:MULTISPECIES: hypothetical protein [Rhodococcus]|uniref:hypothetical protein n=1 Tax=Rhodococcus TaxID=1827 RepID=UPI0013A5A37D|nr:MULTISPECIES: hypothetical protein [Rhodococcus]QTJ67469.1 hypothetical protein HYG77_19010 [Rhodococcus sp. ZPP]